MGGRQISKGSLDMDSRKKNMKDNSRGDWSSGSDKDKKQPPKLDSTKFRNTAKVHFQRCLL